MTTWTASAPGKVMLLGEYAVLAGHPALVMAANRRACVSYRESPGWQLFSDGIGPEAPGAGGPTSALLDEICSHLNLQPVPGELRVDSRPLQQAGHKLGLGSSAAVSVALASLLARLCKHDDLTLPQYIAAHDRLQGVAGSGFDVAAALLGGWLRFQRPAGQVAAEPRPAPPVALAFIWTGQVARTAGFIRDFRSWQQRAPTSAGLLQSMAAATDAAIKARTAAEWLAAGERFEACLQQLASEAGLAIYSGGHARLQALAKRCEVLYKPCGAGGGDLGVAVAASSDQLDRYLALVRDADFQPIDLECDPDGVRIQP